MRFVVLLFGFISVALTALAGVGFFFYGFAIDWIVLNIGIPEVVRDFALRTESPTGQPHLITAIFLGIAAIYGLFGTILGFLRCGKQGGLLMLVPVLGAAVINPFSLVLTGFQLFTSFLAFFVGPLPINTAPANQDEDDEDD